MSKQNEKTETISLNLNCEQLEEALLKTENSIERAELERQLSQAHLIAGNNDKAFRYALRAGEEFIRAGAGARAIGVLVWMRQFSQAHREYDVLERLVLQCFSRTARRAKANDDEVPVPTPYQEISASISFENFGGDEISRHQLKNIPYNSFPLFSNLKAGEILRLLRICELRSFSNGDVLFAERDRPDGFYIMLRGRLELASSAGFERHVLPEEFVGEIALFGNMDHSSTASCLGDVELLWFPEMALKECFQNIPRLAQEILDLFHRRLFLSTAKHSLIFNILPSSELEKCWDYFVPIHVSPGKVLMEPNQESDRMFLILKGKIEVRRYGQVPVYLGAGHFIGERGMILKTMRTATLSTVSECWLLECDRTSFGDLCDDFPAIPRVLEARRKELEAYEFHAKNVVVD